MEIMTALTSHCSLRIKGDNTCKAFSTESGTCKKSLINQGCHYCHSSFWKMLECTKNSKMI